MFVSGVIRLSATSVQYWIATTHSNERTHKKNLIARYFKETKDIKLETKSAIEELSKTYTWGLNHAAY
jgi:hypothetical protein